MNKELQQEIDSSVETFARSLPGGRWAALLRNRLTHDLFSGPTYLTKEGEPCSMFDSEYHHAFNFGKAAQIVRDWCEDNLGTLYFDRQSGILLTKRPDESEQCYNCNGRGTVRNKVSHRRETCETCNGEGHLEVDLSETYEIDAAQVFLGTELNRTI